MGNKGSVAGCTFGILGDSYSTFEGWIPGEYACYYPNPEKVADVLSVENTWWHILMRRKGLQLVINDSYSGSTVCTHVRDGQPLSSAFAQRAKRVFSGQCRMDYIFVFGGTNDSWLSRTVGEPKFSNRTEEDLQQVLPAYCEVLEQLISHNPDSKIIAVVNTDLNRDIHLGIMNAAIHYGVTVVVLKDIHKENGHPSALGMGQIADQIEPAL